MEEKSWGRIAKEGFVTGLSWSFGVTIGFVAISIVLVFFLQQLGGLPVIGSFLASIVESTLEQLTRRTPLFMP